MFFKLMDTNQDGTITRDEFDNFWMQLRTRSTEDHVIMKMNDFYQKFNGLIPTGSKGDFPMTPANTNRA